MGHTDELALHRHHRANKKAGQDDDAWFSRHPDREFRVRAALPHEFEDWAPHGPEERRYVIVHNPHDGPGKKRALLAKQFPSNDETFLRRVWESTTQRAEEQGGGVIDFTPEQHLELLKDAGLAKEA